MTKKMMRMTLTMTLMLLLLAVVRPVEVHAMPRSSGLYAWTTTDMVLRSDPGLYGNIVDVVPAGSELIVVSTDDNPVDGFHWARVDHLGVSGYMAYSNDSQNLEFLEFQKWDDIVGTAGRARIIREVTLYSGPNPELSSELASLEAGREIYIQSEMKPTKYGSNVCRVLWNEAVVGYIPANNNVADFYEYTYLGAPEESSEPSATAPTIADAGNIDKLGIVNRPMCLRTLPTTNSEVLRVLDTFEEVWVEALETNASGEQWYRVITGTTEAYVATFGVNVGGKTLDRDAETVTALNLRSGPSTAAQRWVTLPEGYPVWAMSEFSGVGTSENWIRVAVDLNGRKYYGFVVGRGLSIQ